MEWFGVVKNGTMCRNAIGEIAFKLWKQIPDRYEDVVLDAFEVMPNHLHGIIVLIECGEGRHVVCDNGINDVGRRDANIRVSTENNFKQRGGITGAHNPMLTRASLSNMLRWYKGRMSFEIHKIGKEFVWHPRFYDHIIRSKQELEGIRNYIRNNPAQWEKDRNNPKNIYFWMD
jgi:putative transposase